MTEINMPSLSDSMEEGTILTWLRAPGDTVAEGEDLLEIETDKATMTYQSPAAGVLEIVAAEGSTLPVGAVVARLGADGDGGGGEAGTPEPDVITSSPVSADASSAGASAPASAAAPAGEPSPSGAPRSVPPADGAPGEGNGAVRATPLARRLAGAHDVDLTALRGSGPGGRIRRADVERAAGISAASAPRAPTAAAPGPPPPAGGAPSADGDPGGAKGTITTVAPTRLQQTVARRMAQAKSTIPEFQVETEVAFDAALALRAQFKQAAGEAAPSLNDLIIKACALALRDHPRVNGSYRDGAFELYGRVNVGMAVAAPDALVVATVFDADTPSLGALAAETRRLAERVRSGEITPPELAGATFTVSNLGMYGMTAITPVINPPQAAILGVGAARGLPAVIDGALVERRLLTLRLSCDHRILYGADAAEFLATVRRYLESPLTLAL